MKERDGEAESGAARADELDRGLAEVLPGYVPLDRDLALDPGRAASRVGVDTEGRLVLVLEGSGGESDALALAVLDALAWATEHRALLVRHLAVPALKPDSDPLVVLVCDQVPPRLAQRLEALSGRSVLLLERRELSTAGARSSYLVPHAPAPSGPRPRQETRAASGFLERLDEERQLRADRLLRRLGRLDEALACAGGEKGLRWSFHGVEVCELGEDARGLVGRVAGLDEPLRVGADDALETFLDAAIARYLRLSRELEEAVQDPAPASG